MTIVASHVVSAMVLVIDDATHHYPTPKYVSLHPSTAHNVEHHEVEHWKDIQASTHLILYRGGH